MTGESAEEASLVDVEAELFLTVFEVLWLYTADFSPIVGDGFFGQHVFIVNNVTVQVDHRYPGQHVVPAVWSHTYHLTIQGNDLGETEIIYIVRDSSSNGNADSPEEDLVCLTSRINAWGMKLPGVFLPPILPEMAQFS